MKVLLAQKAARRIISVSSRHLCCIGFIFTRLFQSLIMFSFHRPKVYRSSTGCCICKAKSSSSRFTDSKKYEDDFLECFKLCTPRQGEICNACVLLVKRWKKLPAGSDRNWQHVVDARAGPGMKSMTKFKSKNKKTGAETIEKIKKKKRFEREYSPAMSDKSDEDMDNVEDFLTEDVPSGPSSCTGSPGGSDCEPEAAVGEKSRRHKGLAKRFDNNRITDYVDFDYWKRETICCGTIYRGLNNEIMLDSRLFKPCNSRLEKCKRQMPEPAALVVGKQQAQAAAAETDGIATTTTKVYSDSSSDSGYDESSNHAEKVSIEEINSQIPQPN
ncbi:unnamed protein product [Brassicogethes aeneus]|uniref:Protein FAM60A n=1 Tax=Brassicogethes aeneus TaxID=1431903 RepID=A0A9P0AST2_BRAAE|nr:unnamed protein product [Brassicogethes aeneus]